MAAAVYHLSFKGIRLELKSECTQSMVLEDCARYLEQTASYVGVRRPRYELTGRSRRASDRNWNSVPVLIEGKAGGFATSEEFLCHV